MVKYLIEGFLLGLAYVAPIGTQNLFVINSALRKNRFKAYQVAFITIFFDISLALSCFFGVGILLDKVEFLKALILILGSAVLVYIGVGLIRSTSSISDDVNIDDSIVKIIATCFVVTWINPQAIIDGSIILGSSNARVPIEMSKYFIMGFCLASFAWFTSLCTIISLFKNKFNEKILKSINVICGVIIIFYGIKLGYSFIRLII